MINIYLFMEAGDEKKQISLREVVLNISTNTLTQHFYIKQMNIGQYTMQSIYLYINYYIFQLVFNGMNLLRCLGFMVIISFVYIICN